MRLTISFMFMIIYSELINDVWFWFIPVTVEWQKRIVKEQI